MDLKYNSGMEQYTLCIPIITCVKEEEKWDRMVFQRNESFLCYFLNHKYVCTYMSINNFLKF